MQKSLSFFSIAVMNKNSLRKETTSHSWEGFVNQKQLLKLFLKDLRNLRKYRRDIPFALTTAMELAGSHALSQTERAWQDSHEGRRERISVISTGPSTVGCFRRRYQPMWQTAILPAPTM